MFLFNVIISNVILLDAILASMDMEPVVFLN